MSTTETPGQIAAAGRATGIPVRAPGAVPRMRRRGKLTSGMARRSLPAPRSGPPVRTCVGCRNRAAKSDLLRVVGRGDEVVPDPQARLPGRGAYVHPSQTCFEQAQRRRGFSRALRLSGPADTAVLGQYLAQLCGESRAGPPGAARWSGDPGPSRGSAVAKVRVYELAKEFGVESKAVMAKLQEMGEFVRSASSTIEAPVVRRLKEAFAAQGPAQSPARTADGQAASAPPKAGQDGRSAPAPSQPAGTTRTPSPAPVAEEPVAP